jgi:methylglyoxal synthase
MRIGLAASHLHRAPGAPLQRWLTWCGETLARELDAELCVVGQTHDDIVDGGGFPAGLRVRRLPARREGGVIRLVAGVVDATGTDALDAIVYLLDPEDPTSQFPEALALKRECVIHRKPFVATLRHAVEWVAIERAARGLPRDPLIDAIGRLEEQTIALVAHDALKQELVAFVDEHFALIDRCARRIATGTTGRLLNELAARHGRPPDWVHRYRSGPDGGDAQIARDILDGRCDRVIFFEDPHVAREHEADIQLLERSARMRAGGVPCINEPVTARRWAAAVAALIEN